MLKRYLTKGMGMFLALAIIMSLAVSPVATAADDIIMFEAETGFSESYGYQTGTEGFQTNNIARMEANANCSGGAFLIIEHKIEGNETEPIKMWRTFTVPEGKGGVYKMNCAALQYPFKGQGWTNPFDFVVNGEHTDAKNAVVNYDDSKVVNFDYEMTVKLKEGQNTFELISTGFRDTGAPLLYLDYVKFTPVTGEGISLNENTVTRIEGESLLAESYTRENASLSGGKYAEIAAGGGSFCSIPMTVNAPKSGKYKLESVAIKYPEESENFLNPFAFIVNGKFIDAQSGLVEETGVDLFEKYTMEIELNEGLNMIELKPTGYRTSDPSNPMQTLLFLDYVELTPGAWEKPAIVPVPKKSVLHIEGEAIDETTAVDNEYCSGGQYGQADGNTIGADFYFPENGSYTIQFASSAENPTVTINGSTPELTPVDRAGEFFVYKVSAALVNGKNNISIMNTAESTIVLDYFAVCDVPNIIHIEGESLDGYRIEAPTDITVSGGQFISVSGSNNTPVRITVKADIPVQGKYKINCTGIKYADDGSLHPFNFVVNGTASDAKQYMLDDEYVDFRKCRYEMEAELEEGENTFELASNGFGNGGNSQLFLDFVTFTRIIEQDAAVIDVVPQDIAGCTTAVDSETGLTYATPQEGSAVSINMNAAKAGTYLMKVKANKYDDSELKFALNASGEWDAKLIEENAGTIFADYEMYVNLEYGQNSFSIRAAKGGAELKVADISFEPTESKIMVEGETLPEADGYYKGATTVGYVEKGGAITANFYAPKAGSYKMTYIALQYPDNGQSWLCPHSVTLNGDEWDAKSTMTDDPGVAEPPLKVYEKAVNLKEGKNSITFTPTEKRPMTDTYYMALDYVQFVPVYTDGDITLSSNKSVIGAGERLKLKTTDSTGMGICKESADKIIYKSSDENVAIVSDTGIVTGINPGKTTITVSVEKDGQTHTATDVVYVQDGFIIDKVQYAGNKVTVQYVMTKNFSDSDVTLIAASYDLVDGVQTAVREVNMLPAENSCQNLYQTTEIPLDDAADNIVLYVWDTITDMNSLYSKIIVQ